MKEKEKNGVEVNLGCLVVIASIALVLYAGLLWAAVSTLDETLKEMNNTLKRIERKL